MTSDEYADGAELDESSVMEDVAADVSLQVQDLQYEIVEASSKRGKRKLVDNCGYSYTWKYDGKGFTTWTCSVRNGTVTCRASVRQEGAHFERLASDHTHPPVPGTDVAHRLIAKVKGAAAANVFAPASQFVKTALLDEDLDNDGRPLDAVPPPSHLERYANYHRQKTRPTDPTSLCFYLNTRYISDDFVKADVQVGNQRHLVFATTFMLAVLASAKTWFVDGTFKLVKAPFYQLWSVHAFVTNGTNVKQVPLIFVLMSANIRRVCNKLNNKIIINYNLCESSCARIIHCANHPQALCESCAKKQQLRESSCARIIRCANHLVSK